jgi:hypothetical protein
MAVDPQTLYTMLGHLIAETPDLSGGGGITPEENAWLGRARALVEAAGNRADSVMLNFLAQGLSGPLRHDNAQGISAILHRTLATLEPKRRHLRKVASYLREINMTRL